MIAALPPCPRSRRPIIAKVILMNNHLLIVALALMLTLLAASKGVSAANDALPRVFNQDAAELASRKVEFQAKPNDKNYVELLAKADDAMKVEPMSVLDKGGIAPSGDKHDYLSFARYCWPDPTKPNGLPYITRDGVYNPDSDGVKTDKGRMGKVIGAAETLAEGYYYSGNAQYANHSALLLRTWFIDPKTRMNPNLTYSQVIPGRDEIRGYGIIDTVGLSTRLVDSIGLLSGAPGWTAADQQGMVDWMKGYLDWLQTSPQGKAEDNSTNNHGTWYDVQVASLALFTGQDDKARAAVEEAKVRRLAGQIEPDGSQPLELKRTRSFSYSVYNLSAYVSLAILGDRVGVDLWDYQTSDGRGIRKALDFLLPYADVAKRWPYQQITSDDRKSFLPVLSKAYAHYRAPEIKAAIDELEAAR